MSKEEIRLQVAISALQGILEAKHGVIGEIVPQLLVADSLRIADEFVKQWDATQGVTFEYTLKGRNTIEGLNMAALKEAGISFGDNVTIQIRKK